MLKPIAIALALAGASPALAAVDLLLDPTIVEVARVELTARPDARGAG